MIRTLVAALGVAIIGYVLAQDAPEVSGQDYDPLHNTLDYHAPDGFNAQGRIDQVVEQADNYSPGDGVTGL